MPTGRIAVKKRLTGCAFPDTKRGMKLTPVPLLLALAGLLAALNITPAQASATPLPETPEQHDARMAWFRDARFGMFIHWGVYSVPAGEWKDKKDYGEWFLEETKMPVSEYEKFAGQFNPVKFDAKEWVRMAKDAGMKYIVITSKHHDGFGLWPSKLNDWNISRTAFQRDPLKELADACQVAGIKLCFYHSIMDWHHPDWGTRRKWNDLSPATPPDMDHYTDYMKAQLKELLTGYGPIGILWFDGEWEKPWTHERGVDLYNFVRGLQPNIIINNRVGKARAGMSGMDQGAERIGDYGTPEQEIPATGFGPGVDWESCMTMNNHWGYNKNDHNFKSATTLIQHLVDCSSKGGNYLLNIGPTSEGLFPEPCVERLAAIGKWMSVNSEAIYGTQAGPFENLNFGRCTQKSSPAGTTLYLHVFYWPSNGKLVVRGLKSQPEEAFLLADPARKRLKTKMSADGLIVSVPAAAPDASSSVVVLKIKGAPVVEPVFIAQDRNGSIVLQARDACLRGGAIKYEFGPQRDNIGYWFNSQDYADWDVQVTKPGQFEVSIETASPDSASLTIALGDQKVKAAVSPTGDFGKFKTATVGVLEIASKGEIKLTVKPVKQGWNPINLKSVTLKPVEPGTQSQAHSL